MNIDGQFDTVLVKPIRFLPYLLTGQGLHSRSFYSIEADARSQCCFGHALHILHAHFIMQQPTMNATPKEISTSEFVDGGRYMKKRCA